MARTPNQANARGDVPGSGATSADAVKGSRTANQSIPNQTALAGTPTTVSYTATDEFDTPSAHDASGDPDKFYGNQPFGNGVQALVVGVNRFAANANGERGITWGADSDGDGVLDLTSGRGMLCSGASASNVSKVVMLTATGFVEGLWYSGHAVQASGGALNLTGSRFGRAIIPTLGAGGTVNDRDDVVSKGVPVGQINARRDAPGGLAQEAMHIRTDGLQQVQPAPLSLTPTFDVVVTDRYDWSGLASSASTQSATIDRDGYWLCIYNANMDQCTIGRRWNAQMRKNGTNLGATTIPNNNNSSENQIWVAHIVEAVAGDEFDIIMTHNSTGNANIKQNSLFLFRLSKPPGAAALEIAKITRPAAQTIANNNFTVPITFTDLEFDEQSSFWNAGTPTVLTAPEDGIYFVLGFGSFVANATGDRGLDLAVNGTRILEGTLVSACGGNAASNLIAPALLLLNQGDTISLYPFQTSGGNLNFAGARLAAYLICKAA